MPVTMTRRTTLALGAAAAASTLFKPHVARAAAPFEQPPLPYGEDALAPQISARTVGLHYGKHHAGYYTKLNELVPNTPYADMTLEEVVKQSKDNNDNAIFNQAGQAWNHEFYWQQFAGGPKQPNATLEEAATRDFGGVTAMNEAIVKEAGNVFGTGWVWLLQDGDKLAVRGYQDAGNPLAEGLKPLMGIDVWEHAYYLDYENRRADHVKTLLAERVNWAWVSEQLAS
ncbi:MAG TPA: superoxide dismutase [Tianweitania sediminis]|nr:superoxide dismutase [Tianweitania sediminis]